MEKITTWISVKDSVAVTQSVEYIVLMSPLQIASSRTECVLL